MVKIGDAAKRAGLQAQFVKTEQDTIAQLQEPPLVVILDLNCNSVDPIQLIKAVKQENPKMSIIGFVSHVQGELKQLAQESGCDMVMARSAFSQNLPQILKRHAGAA